MYMQNTGLPVGVKENDLATIPTEAFYVGMHIPSYIYCRYEGKYIFLCKDKILDNDLIQKLKRLGAKERLVYVDKKCYQQILELSEQFRQRMEERKRLKNADNDPELVKLPELSTPEMQRLAEVSYKNVIADVDKMMREVLSDTAISMERIDDLSDMVFTQIEELGESSVVDCINILKDEKSYIRDHSSNVAYFNGLIADWLGLSRDEKLALIKTGLLHDLGMVRIPKKVIDKKEPLTKLDTLIIQRHPQVSEMILRKSGEKDERVILGALYHHECINGQGYPHKLVGEEIPLFARITAISDSYDAIVSKRPYRPRKSPFDALAEFSEYRFSTLDQNLVNIVLRRLPQDLIGKRVILSDHQIARVLHINSNNYAYPIVRAAGKTIQTTPALRCVSMSGFLTLH